MTVTTLVPEADPDLLSQRQANPADVRNNRTVQPDHVPIIEAYLEYIQTSYRVYSTWPLDPEDPDLLAAPSTAEGLSADQAGIRESAERGEVLNVEQGVTFRPWIAGPVGDTVTLYDCELAGHYWQHAETGEPVPPDEVWVGAPGQIIEVGVRWEMVFRGGQWLVGDSHIDPAACA